MSSRITNVCRKFSLIPIKCCGDISVRTKVANQHCLAQSPATICKGLQEVSKILRDGMLKWSKLKSASLCSYRVTKIHQHPRTHPWPRLIHQPSFPLLPRTAFQLSSQLHIHIHIHIPTHIRTSTQQRNRTTLGSRLLSVSIHSTCTSPRRATVNRAGQTPAVRQSPPQPQ